MQVIQTIDELRKTIADYKHQGNTIGFVPTMGNLHAGHLSLVTAAKQHADITVVSNFVNPLQFAPHEDFDTYPRTLDADLAQLAPLAVDIVFCPSTVEMYPDGGESQTQVAVPNLGKLLCGMSRPHFFGGVCTVVNKLFNIVQPDLAVFGEKDFQQLTILRQMVKDLGMPITIIGAPIIREADGLAMSSRNNYLSPLEREAAPWLQQTLINIKERILQGESNFATLEQAGKDQLQQHGFVNDYLCICSPATLAAATEHDAELIILAAAKLGETRLIDNTYFSMRT